MTAAWPGLPEPKTSAPRAAPGSPSIERLFKWECPECDVYESATRPPGCFVCGAVMVEAGAKRPTDPPSALAVRLAPFFPAGYL